MTLNNPGLTTFTPTDGATDYNVAAGVAGYVDTDMSATLPAGILVVFLRAVSSAPGATAVGARKVGETVDVAYTSQTGHNPLVAVSDNRHLELYRSVGGDNHYLIMGYMR